MDNDILQEVFDKEMTQYRRLLKNTYKCPAIYIITNNINGKQFVGCCTNLEDTINYYNNNSTTYKSKIQQIMHEEGIDNFTCDIELHPDKNSATIVEEANRLMLELNTIQPKGYNNALRKPYNNRNKKHTCNKSQHMPQI